MAKRFDKDKRESGGFVPMPHQVIRSEGYAQLSPYAVKLLNDLLAQYNGKNNGDLCCAWKLMHPRGWKSKQTLYRAKQELLEGAWIEVTRQGGRNTPSLYAVTFFAVDDCNGKHDVTPTHSPKGTWRLTNTRPPDLTQSELAKKFSDTAGVPTEP